ncbi:MAG TPA: helix-turn-helix domain-containing protein [Polyangia bacterium]|nr:helix-turn-helix domain-containing protein [Polyangia bacterium]
MRRTDARGGSLSLLAGLEEIRLLGDASAILRRAVELARDALGMKGVRILWLDRPRDLMLGTWGMDRSGNVVDEHDLVMEATDLDAAALRQQEQEGAYFTVFQDCPLYERRAGHALVVGRGWVAKTPIRSTRTAIAMFSNDAGTGDAGPISDRVDEVKQAHAAILCSLLGEILTPIPRCLSRPVTAGVPESLLASAVEMLDEDPALAGKQLAAALNTNLPHLTRVFRILMGISLVDYRNRLRLRRFEALLERGSATLKAAVREAGFGSYAQFHRVFRAHLGESPRQYLRRRGPAAVVAAGGRAQAGAARHRAQLQGMTRATWIVLDAEATPAQATLPSGKAFHDSQG